MNLKFSRRTLSPSFVFFFPSKGTFHVGDMGESPGLNRNGHLHQKGEDEETHCPDAEGDHQLQEIRDIFVDLAKGIRDKSWYNETRPFFNPDSYDDENTAQIESGQSFPGLGDQEDDEGDNIHHHRRPYPGHELVVTMEAFKLVFKRCNMDRLRIILFI